MAGPLNGRRVLVVEDETLIAMLAEEMLAELGCIVHGVAANVSAALELAEAGGFDAAILDVNVARERVFPVADLLAERNLPFAFTSGYGEDEIAGPRQSRPLLGKPYTLDDLERALRTALGV